MDHQSIITASELECMLSDETAEPRALPLSLLKQITNDFSHEQEIGRGGFAVVYKGMLENRSVAVKRMFNTHMYEKEFQREVECLMKVKHKNVVRFLGYCADTQGSMEKYNGKYVMADVQQRLLCFEYLPKGSLHEYITDTSHGLRWIERYQIITGICQGLHYLHQQNIVHLDLKPANILLDDNWVPKITDFGISRWFDEMQSQVMTKIAGTPGYWAPECFNNTKVTYRHSYRLDIYSLGVVITEILTGERGNQDVDNVVESWSNLEKPESDVHLKQVQVCAEIGIECIASEPAKRPDTKHIINILNDYIETAVITSQQAADSLNELHQDTPNVPEQISSEENTSAVTVAGMVNEPMYTHLQKNSAKLEMTNEPSHTLSWYYQQLNPDIRRCLEYCLVFPRRFKLRKVDLVRLWIAEEFVQTSCATKDMEDVAEGYIQQLVSYSFLQPQQTSSDCFTVHDTWHQVLDRLNRKNFRIERSDRRTWGYYDKDVPPDAQHLFIEEYDEKLIMWKILGLKNLRTLIINNVLRDTRVKEKVIESICKMLPNLRVLAVAFNQDNFANIFSPAKSFIGSFIEFSKSEKFFVPKSIGELKHLRYLAFRTSSSCRIILPSTLNNLQHIQLLDFGRGEILEFSFANLVTLRQIFCWCEKFRNVGRLILLQTLPVFTVSNEKGYGVNQLRDLNKLCGSLVIRCLGSVKSKEEALEANLVAKERLTKLTLRWDYGWCSPEVEDVVLEGLKPPVGLEILHIWGYKGSRYPDWMMCKQNGGLKDLLQLWFWECDQQGPAPLLSDAFPHLGVLKLWACSWDALPGNIEHLTSLKKLHISRCLNIRSLPTLPQSLEEFRLVDCIYEFTESCRTVGHPNWQRIEHISNKIIGIPKSTKFDTILGKLKR